MINTIKQLKAFIKWSKKEGVHAFEIDNIKISISDAGMQQPQSTDVVANELRTQLEAALADTGDTEDAFDGGYTEEELFGTETTDAEINSEDTNGEEDQS